MKESPIILQRLMFRILAIGWLAAQLFLSPQPCAANVDVRAQAQEPQSVRSADALKDDSKVGVTVEAASSAKEEGKHGVSNGASDPELIEARYKLGMIALSKNDWDAASADFSKVLEWNASHLGALMNLGWIAQRKREWAESEVFMRRAIAVDSDNPAVWLGLGLAALEQSKLEAAIAAFAQVVALDPKSARGHRFFGLALGRRGWIQAAEEELRRSLEIEPDDAGAHFNLAVFYLQRKPVAIELGRRHYYRALDLGFGSDPAIEEILKNASAQPNRRGASEGAAGAEPVNE